ncbi:MAG: YdbH domain-containing protein [Candidatus Omnitrophica bacterium]|nr:YdbH domain-containing protein [Candidatus Omnitrophota bacterium]
MILAVTTLCACLYYAGEPAVRFVAVRYIRHMLPGSSVSIKRCSIVPLSSVSLSGICVRRDNLYDIGCDEIIFKYAPGSLISHDVQADVRNARINIRAADCLADLTVSCGISSRGRTLTGLRARVEELKVGLFEVRRGYATIPSSAERGTVRADTLAFGKAALEKVRGNAFIRQNTLLVTPFRASLFGGGLNGTFELDINRLFAFRLIARGNRIDLGRIVSDFDLGKKFQLEGEARGSVRAEGTVQGLTVLEGDFSSLVPGGYLTITDDAILKDIADRSKQDITIIMDSFRKYHYNSASARIGLQRDNIVVGANMEGEAGKRDLEIVLHNMGIIKEGK